MVRILSIALISMVIFGADSYCQTDADKERKVFEGTVSSVDSQTGRMVVKGITVETFVVPVEASIVQELYDIKLSDLKKDDYITVDYFVDKNGKKIATNINLEYKQGSGW